MAACIVRRDARGEVYLGFWHPVRDIGQDLSASWPRVSKVMVWERLGTLSCDVAQGHLIRAPMPVPEFMDWKDRGILLTSLTHRFACSINEG
jgi:hypothetical protein